MMNKKEDDDEQKTVKHYPHSLHRVRPVVRITSA